MEANQVAIRQGQCGLCEHFGEHHPEESKKLSQIRKSKRAEKDLIEECGHPIHASLHLRVNVASGCDGFAPASSQA